jgi:hypothetical protein
VGRPEKRGKKGEAMGSRQTPPSVTLDPFLAATVFITGAAVLVIEIAGSRVLAPYYGSGLYSWSALISVTLAALAAGYALGGKTADRRPTHSRFFALILLAGVLVFAIPWVGRFVIRSTSRLGPRLGVLSAALFLFLPPLALLGAATPFAIRLAHPESGGAASGPRTDRPRRSSSRELYCHVGWGRSEGGGRHPAPGVSACGGLHERARGTAVVERVRGRGGADHPGAVRGRRR